MSYYTTYISGISGGAVLIIPPGVKRFTLAIVSGGAFINSGINIIPSSINIGGGGTDSKLCSHLPIYISGANAASYSVAEWDS